MAQNEISDPSPAAIAAIIAAAHLVNRYPDPLATGLRDQLAARHEVDPDCILIGNGSDELLFLLATAYGGAGRTFVCADPPYWGHAQPAVITGTTVERVSLDAYRHDLSAMATHDGDIAFICNPHNPTGTTVSREKIAKFRAESSASLVLVDEAYIDFADDPEAATAVPLIAEGNLCVLRTFSKYHGLAGLRIGYLIGSAELITTLRSIRAPFSVNVLAQAAASAVLEEPHHVQQNLASVRRNRAALMDIFYDSGFSSVPSQANFVLILCPDDEDALLAILSAAGVSVRPGTNLGLRGSIRVTVPDDDGLYLVAKALRTLPDSVATPEHTENEPA